MNLKSATKAAITTAMATTAKMLRHTRRSTASGAVSASDSSSFEAELSEAKVLQAAFYRPFYCPSVKPQILAMPSRRCPAKRFSGSSSGSGSVWSSEFKLQLASYVMQRKEQAEA